MRKFKDIEFRDNFIFFSIIIVLIAIFFIKDYKKSSEEFMDIKHKKNIQVVASAEAENIISERASIAIKAIKFINFRTLKKIIHPKKGLRFSPYPYILQKDIVISKNDFTKFFLSEEKFIWGVNNNLSPIKLSFADYYEYYIYADDFANYDYIYYNPVNKENNIIDNTRQFYPKAIFVEYHIYDNVVKNVPNYRAVLKLVFEEYRNNWYLTGVINVRGMK